MKIRDQIRSRREALEMSFGQLALRIGVTEQAVRHWESGRSYPGKNKAKIVEEALGIQLDWTEGEGHGERETAASMIRHADIELLIKLCELPVEVKLLFEKLADQFKAGVTKTKIPEQNANKGNTLQPFMTESKPVAGTPAVTGITDTTHAGSTLGSTPQKQRRSFSAAR